MLKALREFLSIEEARMGKGRVDSELFLLGFHFLFKSSILSFVVLFFASCGVVLPYAHQQG